MSNQFQKAGEFLRDAVQEPTRQVLSDHHYDGHIGGFSRAAGIALRRIQEKLDAYREAYSQNPKDDSCDGVYCGLEC